VPLGSPTTLGMDLVRYGEPEIMLATAYVIPFITSNLTMSVSLTTPEYMLVGVRPTLRKKPPMFLTRSILMIGCERVGTSAKIR
jgi:hypothetical protein